MPDSMREEFFEKFTAIHVGLYKYNGKYPETIVFHPNEAEPVWSWIEQALKRAREDERKLNSQKVLDRINCLNKDHFCDNYGCGDLEAIAKAILEGNE